MGEELVAEYLSLIHEPEMTSDQDRLSSDYKVITLVQLFPKNRSFHKINRKNVSHMFIGENM